MELGCTSCHNSPLVGGELFNRVGIFHLYRNQQDLGRYAITRHEVDRYVFKVPSRINSTWGGSLADMVRSERYLQIIEHIKQQIASQALRPGDQLPTVRALAQELRVNFNTVARAYRMLDEAGVISTQQGRGTYITENPPPELGERLRQEALMGLARRYIRDALRLGFPPDELGVALQRQLEIFDTENDEGE